MRVQCINKTRLALFCRFVLQLPHTILSLSLFDVPIWPSAHFSSSFSHLSLCTRYASLCLYRRPMSWWPLKSLKTARVSKGTVGGGGNRKWGMTSSSQSLSQKMRRSRRRRFGSWRCSGPWSRTTSWSWRKLFAGEENSTWSSNMLRGSVQQCRFFFPRNAHVAPFCRP